MSTLAEINETLITQNTVLGLLGNEQTRTTKGIARLNQYMESQADELREAKSEARAAGDDTPPAAPAKGAGTEGGGVFDKLGFLKGIVGKAAIAGLLGSVAVMLADEIGGAIKAITGSEILGILTEAGLVGAGLGSIFGIKGAIFGAIVVGTKELAEFAGDKMAEKLREMEFPAPEIGGALTEALGLAAGGAAAGAMIGGPFGALIGAVAGLAAGGVDFATKYMTDLEYREAVNAEMQKIQDEISALLKSISDGVNSFLEENVRDPLVGVADTVLEFLGLSTSADKALANQNEEVVALQNQIDALEAEADAMTQRAQYLRREARAGGAQISYKGLQGDALAEARAANRASSEEARRLSDQAADILLQRGALIAQQSDVRAAALENITASQQDSRTTVAEMATNFAETTQKQIQEQGLMNVAFPKLRTGSEVSRLNNEAEATNNAAPAVNVGRVGDEVTNLQSTTLAGESRPSTANSSTPESYTQVVN